MVAESFQIGPQVAEDVVARSENVTAMHEKFRGYFQRVAKGNTNGLFGPLVSHGTTFRYSTTTELGASSRSIFSRNKASPFI